MHDERLQTKGKAFVVDEKFTASDEWV